MLAFDFERSTRIAKRECQDKNGINKYWKFALKIDGFELLYIHDTQSIKVGQFKWTDSLCICLHACEICLKYPHWWRFLVSFFTYISFIINTYKISFWWALLCFSYFHLPTVPSLFLSVSLFFFGSLFLFFPLFHLCHCADRFSAIFKWCCFHSFWQFYFDSLWCV